MGVYEEYWEHRRYKRKHQNQGFRAGYNAMLNKAIEIVEKYCETNNSSAQLILKELEKIRR